MQTLVGGDADKTRFKQQLSLKYALNTSQSPAKKARLMAAFNVIPGMNDQKMKKALGNVSHETKDKHCNNPLGVLVQKVQESIQSNKLVAEVSISARAVFVSNVLAVRAPGCNENGVSVCTDEQVSTFQSKNDSFTYPALRSANHFLVMLTESTPKGFPPRTII